MLKNPKPGVSLLFVDCENILAERDDQQALWAGNPRAEGSQDKGSGRADTGRRGTT